MSTPGELLEALGREARARLGVGAGAASGSDARMRTYRGRSVEELIPRIERDLGADAVIVRRREGLTGGVLGFFQHAFVEIEAMPGAPRVDVYDDDAAATPPPPQAATAPRAGEPARRGCRPRWRRRADARRRARRTPPSPRWEPAAAT